MSGREVLTMPIIPRDRYDFPLLHFMILHLRNFIVLYPLNNENSIALLLDSHSNGAYYFGWVNKNGGCAFLSVHPAAIVDNKIL